MPPDITNDVNTEAETSSASEATRESQTGSQVELEGEGTLDDAIKNVMDKHFPDSETETKEEEKSAVKELERTEEAEGEEKVEKKPEATKQETKTQEQQVEKKELTEDEIAKLPKRAQERIRELVAEKNGIEEKFKTQYAEPAGRMRNIETFCQKNNIDGGYFDKGVQLMALVRNDPQKGIAALEAELVALKQATGQMLPADLQKKVDEGLLDPETASETAKLRLEKTGRGNDQKLFQQQQAENIRQQISSATVSWEQTKMSTDPDFKKKTKDTEPDGKYEMVGRLFKDRFWNGAPLKTIADVVSLLEKCYEDTNASLKQFIPKPRVIKKPVTSSHTQSRQEEEPINISKSGWARKVADGVLAKRGIER